MEHSHDTSMNLETLDAFISEAENFKDISNPLSETGESEDWNMVEIAATEYDKALKELEAFDDLSDSYTESDDSAPLDFDSMLNDMLSESETYDNISNSHTEPDNDTPLDFDSMPEDIGSESKTYDGLSSHHAQSRDNAALNINRMVSPKTDGPSKSSEKFADLPTSASNSQEALDAEFPGLPLVQISHVLHPHNAANTAPYEYAQKILSKYDICYLDSPKSGKPHIFNGKIWEPRDIEDLKLIAYEEIPPDERKSQGNIDNFCKRIVEFILFECREKYNSGEKQFTDSDFQTIANRIVFNNCVYDAQSKKILGHDKNLPYYFGIDTDYLKKELPTPTYDKLKFNATKGDEDSMRMFDLMLGYLMLPNRTGKCYFVMASAKDSGKSVLGHFIESMYMGERVKLIDLEHLSKKYALSKADSAVLLSCLETTIGNLEPDTVTQIKRITGEDKIRIESKYQNEQTTPIRFKLLLATNGGIFLPKTMSDPALYRRTIVIPFIQSIPLEGHMANMPEMLGLEKSAILSKAAKAITSIIKDDGGILFPESNLSKCIKIKWMGFFDYTQNFIKQRLIFTGIPDDAIPKEELYEQYQLYFKKSTAGNTNAIMCTKDELMKCLLNTFPGTASKKLRRQNANDTISKPRPCLTGIRWKA